jgi:REP element-mobilizing transposase RayT
MANTFTQIYIMLVFSVKNRERLLKPIYEQELYQYIKGIIKAKEQNCICINGTEDHIHILVNLSATKSISDLVRDIKANSSKWINQQKWFLHEFHWQHGYGAFSYSHSQINSIISYIKNQKEHHQKVSFQDEFKSILQKFNIDYDEKFLFD